MVTRKLRNKYMREVMKKVGRIKSKKLRIKKPTYILGVRG